MLDAPCSFMMEGGPTMSEPEQPSDKSPLWNLVHLSPALYIGLVVAVAGVLGAFGLAISGEQKESLGTLVLSVVAILQAVWTGAKTTPNKKVVVVAPDPIAQPTLVVPGEATTTARQVDILDAARGMPQ
jgi:hypothetical protein